MFAEKGAHWSGLLQMAALPTTPRLAAVARAVLAEPHGAPSPRAVRHVMEGSSGWADYLLERGWLNREAFHAADNTTQMAGLAVLSAALTFPMTLARHLNELVGEATTCKICIVGARAEAALPDHIWNEVTSLTGVKTLDVEFAGPSSAPPNMPSVRSFVDPSSQCTTRLFISKQGDLYHRSDVGRALLARAHGRAEAEDGPLPLDLPDAYVLFNPGLGEPGWERAWEPTMSALFAADRPLLMTALSRQDAARDEQFIADRVATRAAGGGAPVGRAAAEYTNNPYRSLLSANGEGLIAPDDYEAAAANSCARMLV